ncbi:MAG: hypothetical protein AMXMBFR7_38620 [Planctomycetota bacterium]
MLPGSEETPPQPHRFGELAVELSLITEAQLKEAVEQQWYLKRRGDRTRLGDLLVKARVLDAEGVKRILAEQRRRRMADADKKLPMERFGDYRLLERLGRGRMGDVYKAKHVLAERVVALKVLGRNKNLERENLERFQRELRLAGQLEHPNLVKTYDAGVLNGVQFLEMEYVEGESLDVRIARLGKLDEAEALQVAIGLTRALEHAHAQGLVHRDVKPDNVLLAENNLAKLCDLGLAKSLEDSSELTLTGQVVGTPHYLSPEQALGQKPIDHRADLYSLGATLYHTLTGRTPFEAHSAGQLMEAHVRGKLTNPKDANPSLSGGIVAVVTKLMAKNAADRYASATELLADLERLQRGEAPLHAGLDANRSVVLPPGVAPERLQARERSKRSGCLGRAGMLALAAYWLVERSGLL